MNLGRKREVHVVLSNIGGCGKTKVSALLAERIGGFVLDANPSHRDISKIVGLEKPIDTEKFYSKFEGKSQFYLQYIIGEISTHFQNDDTPIVIDLGDSMSISYLALMSEIEDFMTIYNNEGIHIFFHILIPARQFKLGKGILQYFLNPNISEQVDDHSVTIWINKYRGDFLKHTIEKDEVKIIEDRLGNLLNKIVTIGEGDELSKKYMEEYLSGCTYSYLLENKKEVGCNDFDLGRIRGFVSSFFGVVDEVFLMKNKKEKAVATSVSREEAINKAESSNTAKDDGFTYEK